MAQITEMLWLAIATPLLVVQPMQVSQDGQAPPQELVLF
jgi:hypothetical protein